MASVTIDIDLPDGIEITAYHRLGEAHGFEVTWPWPDRCRCELCGHEDDDGLELIDKVRVARDLDLLSQATFWCYKALAFRCRRCHHRQHIIPPFKRKDTSYTFRFEEHVLRSLIGSNEEEVARRLGISAETVAHIVKNQVSVAKRVDPARVVTDVGMDEISLKKRHKLYVTVLTDLSRPDHPEVLATAPGRDEAAGKKCLECLTSEQRGQVRTYRVDMGLAFNKACATLLPNAQGIIDRFHVAQLWGDAIDGVRKKNHAWPQEEALDRGAEGVSFGPVGVSPQPQGLDEAGPTEVGEALQADTAVADLAPIAGSLQGDL